MITNSMMMVANNKQTGALSPTGENLVVLDSYPGTNLDGSTGIAISEDGLTAFVTGYASQILSSFDISDKSNITLISTISSKTPAEKCRLFGTTLFVTGTAYVVAFDVSDPANMVELGNVPLSTAQDIVFNDAGTVAFVASRNLDGVVSIDITNLNSLSIIQTLVDSVNNVMNYAVGIAKRGNYIFVSTLFGDLVSIDATDPSNMVIVGSIPTGYVYAMSIVGNTMFFVETNTYTLMAYDITDPSAFVFISSIVDTTHFNGSRAVYHTGDILLITSTAGYLTSVNVTDAINMQVVDFVYDSVLNGTRGVDTFENTALVTAYTADTLTSIDIT